jgi:four helix bundle protein
MSINSVNVYKIALNLSKEIDDWVKKQSHFWRNKEIEQIQRSSASVVNNIAEGYAYKSYPKKYLFFLHIALGSSDETQSHLKILRNRGLLADQDFKIFFHKYKDLSIRILNLIQFIKSEKII